jgi:hypothetical protein
MGFTFDSTMPTNDSSRPDAPSRRCIGPFF